MSRIQLRRIAAALSVAVVLLGGFALPAAAKGGPGRNAKIERVQGKDTSQTKSQRGKSAEKRQSGRSKKARNAKFAAAGVVSEVDAVAGFVFVTVKGGTPNVRGGSRTFAVADDARINRNDVKATLEDLLSGDHVAVKGTVVEGAFVAHRINAEGDEVVEESVGTDPGTDQVADEGTGEDTGDGTGEDTGDGTGEDTGDGTGQDAGDGAGEDTVVDPNEPVEDTPVA